MGINKWIHHRHAQTIARLEEIRKIEMNDQNIYI